jgi:signal transduction histidine kinase
MRPSPRILIIDDVLENVAVLGETLSDPYEIQFATSAMEGLELIRRTPPDLILLDVMMPELDGYELCSMLKRDPSTRDIPVIFVTAKSDTESESHGLSLGAVDFIQKPINREVVRARVLLHLTLKSREAELQSLNADLESKVAQRTLDLSEALVLAEDAARMKSEFLANMSHELRTPLNAVIGLAQIGYRESVARGAIDNYYPRIQKTGQHLLGVVNDVLDFSKIEAGKLVIEARPFELSGVIEASLEMIEQTANQKGLALHTQGPESAPGWVIGDAKRLQQVLVNLLANATKFTESGDVRLTIEREQDQYRFCVADTGIGLSPAQLSRLFSPFEQADGSTTRRFGGTGLGLVICRNLARQMGGDVSVRSELGKGSEFCVSVPLPAAQAPRPSDETDAISGARLNGIRLLVAEDVELNRFLLGQMLAHEAAEVEFVENGREAVDYVERHGIARIDLILMDVQMPVMDGLEATRRISALAPSVPIVALTAHAMPEERARCLEAGMLAHVAKPIDIDLLVTTVLQTLDGRSTIQLGHH